VIIMGNDPVTDLRERVTKLEACVPPLQTDIALIKASIEGIKENYNLSKAMIQWIIMPLVLILGGLVGIKVVFPGV
jgi:hypothetical protein